MTASLYLLLPLSVVFVILIGAAFWWAIFSGQFDDIQSAAESVLQDDDSAPAAEKGSTDTPVQSGSSAGAKIDG